MDRRKFLQSTIATTAISATMPHALLSAHKTVNESNKFLSSYYFRAHMYTMVPHQVREDLQWMADHGTDAVDVAVLEKDFFAAVENIQIIANEAAKLGLKLFIVPSRWAGLVAGAPKVPSLFSVHNPHTWLLNGEGKPYKSGVSGVYSSIVHPEVVEFFKSSIDKAVDLWDIQGVVWDEPKIYGKPDYSDAAKKKFGGVPDHGTWNQAFNDFWSDINTHIKEKGSL